MDLTEIRAAIKALPAQQRQALERWLRDLAKEDRAADARVPAAGRGALRRAVAWTALTLLAFFLVEAAIFRAGWYFKYLEPKSSTAEIEYALFWMSRAPASGTPEVLVVGDSRIGEGFSARIAQTETSGRLRFRNFGFPGSSPRVWYYTLRDADPHRNRFRAIAIALGQYSDEDEIVLAQDVMADLKLALGRLRLTDCWSFSRSFNNPDLRRQALTGCVLRGIPMRSDLLAFMADMHDRLIRARDWRDHGEGYVDGYGGKAEDLTGLSVDWSTRTIHFPPGLSGPQISSIKATVTPEKVQQTGQLTSYRQQWLGRILDLYKGSSTSIIFFEVPRAPLPIPEATVPARFLHSVERRPHVAVLPEFTFRDLERPELFGDGLHLNHAGRPIFSQRLARTIEDVLEGR